MTLLEKPLGDLRRELIDLRQNKFSNDYDLNQLGFIITVSRDSLREAEVYQQKLLQQLQQFEISLADINQILRTNAEQKTQFEQQLEEQEDEKNLEIRAKIMSLNAEALECRAAAVQLQQEAKIALARAAEIEKRANDELVRQALEMKLKQQEIERNRAAELERRVRLEEERQRLKELEIQQQQQQQKEQERLLSMSKTVQQHDEFHDWPVRDFMHDDQCPQCLLRFAPNAYFDPIEISYPSVILTENLLNNQEELISTPIQIKFNSTEKNQQFLLLSIPYIVKRSTHRENVIKIRQSNGLWITVETNESTFDSHKDKRFVECKLTESSCCAVVSRLKRDKIHINRHSSGRFVSTADSRLTIQWPNDISERDLQLNLRVQPVDLPGFTQFSSNYSHECQGLLAVGPIINFDFEEINLLKPIQFTLPILIPSKKQNASTKSIRPETSQTVSNNQLSQQELILQQQQSIFKSMLGEDSTTERLVLLYSYPNENLWQIDTNVRFTDSKTHDLITMHTKSLHPRMIIVRYDRQLLSLKQLPTTIPLLEQSLNQRTVCFVLRHHRTNPHEICFVCCSNQRFDQIEQNLDEENFVSKDEQIKEIILQEGQLLDLRFRGNVLPNENQEKTHPFAFNTNFPFYFQTNVIEIDKYSQHFSSVFYGFIQIFSKQKVLRMITKENEKKKQQSEIKQEWQEIDVCLAELVVRLPKPHEEIRAQTPKTLPTFISEGILTPTLLRDISTNLNGDEWRRLARRLGLTRMRIEAIEQDYTDERAYYMLLTWFKRVPHSADKLSLLIHGLMNINRWDLAQDLQNIKEEKRQEMKSSSKDDQLRLFQIAFNRICQRDECIRIWKQIARELLLKNDDIERIEQNYSSKQERCLRSLEQWLSKDNRADIITLARVIRSLGFKSLAREIDSLA